MTRETSYGGLAHYYAAVAYILYIGVTRSRNMGVIYETTRVRAREPGSRWMHHAEMDRAPLWQPETTVAQSSSDDTAICQRCPLSSRARFPLPDVLSRSFHNRCFHAIDTKPKDPPSLMYAILTIELSRTSSLFSFSFGSVGFDRVFILFFKRGTIVTLE